MDMDETLIGEVDVSDAAPCRSKVVFIHARTTAALALGGGQQKAWVSFKHLRVMPRKNSGHTSQTAHHGVGGRLQTNWLHLFGSRVWPQGAIREVHGLTTWHFPDEDLLVWDRSRFETLHLEAQDALARWQGPWKRGVHVEACAQPEESPYDFHVCMSVLTLYRAGGIGF